MAPQPPSSYRPDVDGLRALAVLSVLVFHAFPEALPGGFVGVDIFFVISGYLISRIILSDIGRGTFTFTDFYYRRVRRIFPALTLVLLTVLVVGWAGLSPFDFRQLGVHVAAGAGFVSNIVLWRESGYFDAAAELKPLLHLWSLGVEEQYYLAWPLAFFVFRRHIQSIIWLILTVAAISFAMNIFATSRMPVAAFYLPPTRVWELMVGSAIAYAQVFTPPSSGRATGVAVATMSSTRSNVLSAIGVALVATALVLVDRNREFPGWWALLPVGGAALIICAGPDAWFNHRVLSNRVAVAIGLVSYPLYLWHWPLLTYARIFNDGEHPSPIVRIGTLLTSTLLAWLTYRYVEQNVRHAPATSWARGPVPAFATLMTALGIYGLLVFGDISQSRSAAVARVAAVSEAFDDWNYRGDRTIEGDVDATVLFFGDSHMEQYLPRISKLMDERSQRVRTVIFHTEPGCAPVPGIDRMGQQCADFVEEGLRLARRAEVETVVVGASWVGFVGRGDYYKVGRPADGSRHQALKLLSSETQWVWDGFETRLRELRAAGKRIVIVLSSPRGERFDPRRMIARNGLSLQATIGRAVPRSEVITAIEFVDRSLIEIAARVGAMTVSPVDLLCTDVLCPTVDSQGNPIYMDESHVRASYVINRFNMLDRFVYSDFQKLP
jgi:peptidoglycan/LPS O-acetylase OafA/YrhL